jgi:hypothetical protein
VIGIGSPVEVGVRENETSTCLQKKFEKSAENVSCQNTLEWISSKNVHCVCLFVCLFVSKNVMHFDVFVA